MADDYDFGQLGLFLVLAFVMPGFVYLTFFMLYFWDIYSQIAVVGTLKDSLVFQAGLVIIVGLLFTSICWSIEFCLRRSVSFKKYFPDIDYAAIPKLESDQKGSTYLFQLAGQAVMHFNIWLGTTILLIIYLFMRGRSSNLFFVIIGIFVIIANFIVSKNLYKWSSDAIRKINDH